MSYDHRTYPGKRNRPPAGTCTWCLQPILRPDGTVNRRKTFCGPVCVTHYLLRAQPAMMRRHVFFRDQGQCGACKRVWENLSDPWDHDHIVPLQLAFGDPSFWEPENVQILCRDPCHKEKTKADEAKYGFVRRMAKGPKPSKKRVRLADRLT